MTILLCWVIGILFSVSIYLILSRQLMQWLFGIVILSSTANLLIFVVGRLKEGSYPPFVSLNNLMSVQEVSNPLTQALILTAIVISFSLLTFMLVLVRKIWSRFKTLDSDQIRSAEPAESARHPEDTHS